MVGIDAETSVDSGRIVFLMGFFGPLSMRLLFCCVLRFWCAHNIISKLSVYNKLIRFRVDMVRFK